MQIKSRTLVTMSMPDKILAKKMKKKELKKRKLLLEKQAKEAERLA